MNKYTDKLDRIWNDTPHSKVKWIEMEMLMVDVLRDKELKDEEKIKLTKECLDAFTRRGHFGSELWDDKGGRK